MYMTDLVPSFTFRTGYGIMNPLSKKAILHILICETINTNCCISTKEGYMGTHHIMIIVGNGFDTSVLNKYGDNITTSYDNFYRYFKYHYPNEDDNIFIEQMEKLKQENKANWSDFEAILSIKLQQTDNLNTNKLSSDLSKLQLAFSKFLNEVVNDEIIKKLSEDTLKVPEGKKSLAYYSISEFLGDLSKEDYQNNKFQSFVDNHDCLEMVFFNFNYTALLDNYVYLDKNTFDPVEFRTSGNNFIFNSNPKKYNGHKGYNDPYCRLHTSLFHPHGFQDVPKSILFGTELEENEQINDTIKPFIKSYWAQCELNYSNFFDNTELFIIYGCSIGESDKWWWKKIYDRILSGGAELIIYNYGSEERNVVIDKFIKSSGKSIEESESVRNNIYVINHGYDSANEIIFLQLPK